MSFTVSEFEDLIKIIEAKPEWRSRLRRALFPEIDIPKALQALAEAQIRSEAALQRLETEVRELATGQRELATGQKEIKKDVGILKGRSQDHIYRTKAVAIFGIYLRKGQDASEMVADLLYEAQEDSRISEAERRQVLAADLLWSGEERRSKQPIVLVMEAAWLAEIDDVQRALARAAILQKLGLRALPIVGSEEWTDSATELARAERVVRATNGYLDPESWQAAWSYVPNHRPV